MRFLIIVFFVLSIYHSSPDKRSKSRAFEKIHNQAILVDTHNDILTKTIEYGYALDADLKDKTQSDLQRMKLGGLDVQFFSVWSDGNRINPYNYANRQIDILNAVIQRNPDKIVKVSNTKGLLAAVKQHKIAASTKRLCNSGIFAALF